MLLVGFEPTISAGDRPQSYALDPAATGTDISVNILNQNIEPSQFLELDENYKLWDPVAATQCKSETEHQAT